MIVVVIVIVIVIIITIVIIIIIEEIIWALECKFPLHIRVQGAQYGLIKEYGLNYIGIHTV